MLFRASADGQALYEIANLNQGKAVITIPGFSLANGVNIVTAVYQGDANYNPGTSNPLSITISKADFSITTLNPELTIPLAQSGSSTLAFRSINGFTGALTLTVREGSSA